MNTKDSVQSLKSLSEANPVAKSVFIMWALRHRARNSVLVQSLSLRMRREGFNYTDDQYREVLKRVAELGFGKPILSKNGKFRGIEDLKVTLQSLGQAIVGDKQTLQAFRRRHRYEDLKTMVGTGIKEPVSKVNKTPLVAVPAPAGGASAGGIPVSITMVINGKPISFQVPKDLPSEDIATIVTVFRDQFNKKQAS